MKSFIIMFVLLVWSANLLYAQTKLPTPVESKFSSQKKKKKTANTLLITGGSGILLGTLLTTIPTNNATTGTGALLSGMVLITAGTVTSLVSIPFYIDAYYEKKKIGQLQPIVSYSQTSFHKFPQVGFKFTF